MAAFQPCALGTTIEPCYPGEYRDLQTGSCIKAPLGHFAAFGATQPTNCTAGSHADVRGLFACKLCPAGKYEDGRGAIVCKNCTIGNYCPEGSTGGTSCIPGTIRLTLGAAAATDCNPSPLGHYGLNGLPQPCPNGTYQDELGTDSEQDCKRCPMYSTTYDIGRGDVTQCFCENGFVPDFSTGKRVCMCPPGTGIVTAAGIDSCAACEFGKYKPYNANEKCKECKNERWTTTVSKRNLTSLSCACSLSWDMIGK